MYRTILNTRLTKNNSKNYEGESCIFCTKVMETIVCDLELLSFIKVAAIDLLFEPY